MGRVEDGNLNGKCGGILEMAKARVTNVRARFVREKHFETRNSKKCNNKDCSRTVVWDTGYACNGLLIKYTRGWLCGFAFEVIPLHDLDRILGV